MTKYWTKPIYVSGVARPTITSVGCTYTASYNVLYFIYCERKPASYLYYAYLIRAFIKVIFIKHKHTLQYFV